MWWLTGLLTDYLLTSHIYIYDIDYLILLKLHMNHNNEYTQERASLQRKGADGSEGKQWREVSPEMRWQKWCKVVLRFVMNLQKRKDELLMNEKRKVVFMIFGVTTTYMHIPDPRGVWKLYRDFSEFRGLVFAILRISLGNASNVHHPDCNYWQRKGIPSISPLKKLYMTE